MEKTGFLTSISRASGGRAFINMVEFAKKYAPVGLGLCGIEERLLRVNEERR